LLRGDPDSWEIEHDRASANHQLAASREHLADGTLVELGHGAPVCTVVIREPGTFLRLVRDPSPLNFAEAYVECVIDIEGDLFAGMKVADALEEIRLSTVDRLRLVASLWRD
jgi:hypothetical protein